MRNLEEAKYAADVGEREKYTILLVAYTYNSESAMHYSPVLKLYVATRSFVYFTRVRSTMDIG